MRAVLDERQLRHAPEVCLRFGSALPHPEQPERAIIPRDILRGEKFDIMAPGTAGTAPIKAVHNFGFAGYPCEADARLMAVSGTVVDGPPAAVAPHPEGFADMARRNAALGPPIVLVQEGGYVGPSLAANARVVLTNCRTGIGGAA